MSMNKSKDNELTQHRLLEILHYDPVTGVFTWLVATNWRIMVGAVAGTVDDDGYIRIQIDGKRHRAHRLAWLYMTGEWPVREVDHRDLDKAHNAWGNLREATHAQNAANRDSWSESGFKGVTKNGNRFQANIRVDGKKRYLGTRSTPAEAHALYVRAANDAFGEFSRTA